MAGQFSLKKQKVFHCQQCHTDSGHYKSLLQKGIYQKIVQFVQHTMLSIKPINGFVQTVHELHLVVKKDSGDQPPDALFFPPCRMIPFLREIFSEIPFTALIKSIME